MTNKKSTKRALLTSVLALVLCLSMLVGTTFAWFTDTVTSGVNQIVAGNLDVDVYTADNKSIAGVATLFNNADDEPILWEPGAVAYENLTVANLGTLALKYQLAVNFANENTVLTDNVAYGLSSALKVAVVEEIDEGIDREELVAGIDESAWSSLASFVLPGDLLKGESDVYGIVIWWEPSSEDNNWNVQNGKPTSDNEAYLHIDLGINLVATQLVEEKDSFGEDYDENAWTDGMGVYTEADLKAALANSGEVVLDDDIELTGAVKVPEGVTVTLDLNGKTLDLGAFYIENQGVLVLKNGSVVADTFNDTTAGAPVWNNGGTLKVEDGAELVGICAAIRNENNGNVTINGGTLEATCNQGYTSRIIYNKSGSVTINGGTFDGCHSTNPGEGCSIVAGNGATVINGGYFTDFSCVPDAIFGFSTNTTVKGGTFAFVPYDNWTYEQSFTKNGYLAEGYQVIDNGDGTYTVVIVPVAPEQVNGVYQVSKSAELAWLAASTSKITNAALTADIDMNGATISSIEIASYMTFNGNGHTISNVVVDGNGLFENTAGQITIKNITLDHVTVNATSGNYAGIVSSKFCGFFDNVTVLNSSVYAPNSEYVGGLAATVYKKMVNCKVENISVTGAEKVGGLVGFYNLNEVYGSIDLENCSAKNVTLTATNTAKSEVGVIFGRGLATNSWKFSFTNCSAQLKDGQTLIGRDYSSNIDTSAIAVTTIQ